MAKAKKVYRGEDRQELLQEIRRDWGNVQVTQRPFKSLSGKELVELRVVSETQTEEMPVAPQSPPEPSGPSFSDLLEKTENDAVLLGQPEQEDLRSAWKKTQRDLDSLAEQSEGRLAIQHQIVEAAEQAQARIGQVESHAEEIMKVARRQAEEVLEAARAEAERLQQDTRSSLEAAMTGVLQQTAETRSRAAQLAKTAADDAQATLREASEEAAELKSQAHEQLEEARLESDRLLAQTSEKTRNQLREVSEQTAQMLADAQAEKEQMLELARETAENLLTEAELKLAESKDHAAAVRQKIEDDRQGHLERYEGLKIELEAEYRSRVDDLEEQRQAIIGQAGVQAREIIRAAEKAAEKAADRSREMTRSFDELSDSLRSNAKLLIGDIAETHSQIQDGLTAHVSSLPSPAKPEDKADNLDLPDWVPEA